MLLVVTSRYLVALFADVKNEANFFLKDQEYDLGILN